MRKSYIKKAQKRLKSLGYMISVDGIWGNNSKKVLQDFQNSKSLRVDGILGRNTKEALFGRVDNSKIIEDIILEYIRQQEPRLVKVEQIQYIVATVQHETGGTFNPIEEYGKKSYFDKYDPYLAINKKIPAQLGNTEKGDGYKFRGRGFSQLTGRVNYQKYSDIMGIDLVGSPDLALDKKNSIYILVHAMLNGGFTGFRLDKFINSDGTDFINSRRVVNGRDKAVRIANIAQSISIDFNLFQMRLSRVF